MSPPFSLPSSLLPLAPVDSLSFCLSISTTFTLFVSTIFIFTFILCSATLRSAYTNMLHPLQLVYTLQLLSLAEAMPGSDRPLAAARHHDRSVSPVDAYTVHPAQHLVQVSHLSPLLTYHPAEAWDFTPLGAFTDVPGAKVSIDYLGSTFTVMGHRTVPVDVGIWPDVPQRFPGASEDNWKLFAPMDPDGILFHMKSGHSVSYAKRRWEVVLPYQEEDEVEEWPLAPLTVEGVMMSAVVPSDLERDQHPPTDNLDSQPAIQADNSHNPFFRLSGDWTTQVSTSPYDTHTLIPLAGGAFETTTSDSAWPTFAVLSTSSRSASLSFTVAQHASILQVYGNVGPRHGRARLIVNADPDSPLPIDFGQDLVQGIDIDTYRPISASSQLLALVWLDPRVQYSAVLQYDYDHSGKEIQITGVTTKHYLTDIDDVQGDWLEAWNEDMPVERAPVHPVPVKASTNQRASKLLQPVRAQAAAGDAGDVLMFAGMPPTWCCFIIAVFAFGAITGMMTERHQKQKRKRRNSDPHDGLSDSEEGSPVLAKRESVSEKQRDYASMGQTVQVKPKALKVTYNAHARTSSFESASDIGGPISPVSPTSPTAGSDRQGRTTSLPSRYSSPIAKSTPG